MAKKTIEKQERGFTTPEKWIIWAVFCLLVGLSTSRVTVFAGLMLISVGISFIARRRKIWLAIVFCIIGVLNLVFSKYLV